MVAPRALVFGPLVKRNEALGTQLRTAQFLLTIILSFFKQTTCRENRESSTK